MKKAALVIAVITIAALVYGIKRATAQQAAGMPGDPGAVQIAEAAQKARQSGFRGYQMVREEYLTCNGSTKHVSTQTDIKDSDGSKYFGLNHFEGNNRIEIRKPIGTIVVADQLTRRKMTFLPVPGRSTELLLANLIDPATRCKRTFLGEEAIPGEVVVSESDQVLGHPTIKVLHDSSDRMETKWYFAEPQYGCSVAKMILQFKDPQKPGTFSSVSSQEATSLGPPPGPEVFNGPIGYVESDPTTFAEEFALKRITANKQVGDDVAKKMAKQRVGSNPDVADWVERYRIGRAATK
jgi:hypothetical protein